MEQIYFAISSMIERISDNANIRTNTSFRAWVWTPEEWIRKTWKAVGSDLQWAMNEFDNEQKNEKLEKTK